jgi:hypothetical protein
MSVICEVVTMMPAAMSVICEVVTMMPAVMAVICEVMTMMPAVMAVVREVMAVVPTVMCKATFTVVAVMTWSEIAVSVKCMPVLHLIMFATVWLVSYRTMPL